MPIDRRQARALSTRSELGLVSASYPDAIGKLTLRALKSNIVRARKLRDKQRDLLQRQKLATRARTGSKIGGNARTAQKAELFHQTLARFTRRLNSLNKGPQPPARSASKKRGQAALRQKARSPRMKSIQGHVSSRGRRNQARRDSR
jgi:hypothetical protein